MIRYQFFLGSIAFLFALSTSVVCAGDEGQANLKAAAKVAEADAEKTALAQVPGGTIAGSELENENGKLIWSFDIKTPQSRNITEVHVDAKTGEIVATEIETPNDQAKETATEKKETQK